MNTILLVSNFTKIPTKKVENTLKLLDEGCTIPFIARYRKELTGNLDELQIFEIQKEYFRIVELEQRRTFILNTIEKLGVLSDILANKLKSALTANELEDLYLPYKIKRKSKSTKAKEAGLEPIAELVLKHSNFDIEEASGQYICLDYPTVSNCIEGVVEIVAERISLDIEIRNIVRNSFERFAIYHSTKKKITKEGENLYKDYFDYHQKLEKCPAHRILASLRGEKEGFLNIDIDIEPNYCLDKIARKYLRINSPNRIVIEKAIEISYFQHLYPQISKEYKEIAKVKADKESINIFGSNLKQLLLTPPMGEKIVLGVDPGFRTGCKLAVIDNTGKFLKSATIYPNMPFSNKIKAEGIILNLINEYKIEAIAIGNGTAGRETEEWLNAINFGLEKPQIVMVNEAGASIYSASAEGREEYPKLDATVRGSISIAKRLMDPLSELVKIDPKSIGVGQYQHDVNQTMLKQQLDYVVSNVVNNVGVELNTASKWLLQYVSGIGSVLASNIVKYREENGIFKSRRELLKVPRLGEKVYEQCAGFLRIQQSKNPLDNSQVHPERYILVEKMAKSVHSQVEDLMKSEALRNKINKFEFLTDEIGEHTLNQIFSELAKPTRDIRKPMKAISFDRNIKTIDDLIVGKTMQGIVSNITNFGAFVSIGLKNDALLHISQISNSYIQNPSEVLSLGMQIDVKILEIDTARGRVNLTMK